MTHFNDDDLRKALELEKDYEHLATAGDEGLLRQLAESFRSRMRGWMILMWAVNLVLTGVWVWSIVGFFNASADDLRALVMYAAIFVTVGVMVGHVKLWYYMEVNKYTHTREIKRVELQLAHLRKQMSGS